MTSIHKRIYCILFQSLVLLVLAGIVRPVSAQVAAEKFFPDTTKGFIVIRSLKELGEQWDKTQIGSLVNDPIMAEFKKDVRRQLGKRMEEQFGFTLDGIEQLPSGEVAAGMIAIPDRMPGYVFLMDIKDRRKETDDYLDRLVKKLQEAGTKKDTEKYKDVEIVIFTFPERGLAERADTAKSPGKGKAPKPETQGLKAYYVIAKDHLLVSDQMHLTKLMVDRLDGEPKNSLADVEDFKIVMDRCMNDVDGQSNPLIRWYIEPLNYGESIRVLIKGPLVEKRRNKPSIFTILKQQGFDAVRGIGGVVSIKAEDKETVYRIFIHAKKPFKLAMRMLVFPDNKNFEAADWMPGDLARCTMLYVDPEAIFDNFGSLFDALLMQGETGVWDDIVKGLKEDENGPQIDLREEIIVHLGQRVLSMSKYQLPITTQSESIVIAVELKEGKEKEMIAALKKLFENDPEMQGTKHGPYILWHRIPSDDIIKPFSGPTGAPDLVTAVPTVGPSQPAVQPESEPVFPAGAVTVAKGCLFVGTNREYLQTILDRLDAEIKSSIKDEAEYKEVDRIFGGMGITDKPHFLQFFARTDETIRPTYELIREGNMPQSQAILGKMINALFVPEDEDNPTIRQQAIDGKTLPEFDKVRHYFGPSGIYGVSEDDGFFFKGFLLEKKNEAAAEKAEPKAETEVKPEAKPEAEPEEKSQEKPEEKPAAETPKTEEAK